MSVLYFIMPFDHPDTPSDIMDTRTTYLSDLKIDITHYKQALLIQWPDTEFFDPTESSLLRWGLYNQDWGMQSGKGSLDHDQKTVLINTPHIEFILWHRRIISNKYRLLLYAAYKTEVMEVTPDSTVEEIEKFFES